MAGEHPLSDNEKEAALIFTNARGYQLAAGVLDRQNMPIRTLTHLQMVTIEVFALELFIKSLLRLRNIKITGHDVNSLYELVGDNDKTLIAKHFDELIKLHPAYEWGLSKGILLDVASVLERNRKTFVRVRYWHEGKPLTSDSAGNVSNAGTGTLSDAIRQVILADYPFWLDENLAKALKLTENSRPAT